MIFTLMIKISVFAGLENEFSIRSGSISSIISLWPLSLEGHTHRSHDNAWGREVNFPSWASQHISSAIRYGLLLSTIQALWCLSSSVVLLVQCKNIKANMSISFQGIMIGHVFSFVLPVVLFCNMKWNNCYLLRRKFNARFLSPLLSALD